MKLIQAKTRGTGPLLRSGWFQLSKGLNQFHFPDRKMGTAFLRAMQTLQPPFSCKDKDPFALLPRYEQTGQYTRHIQPEKRTIVFGVFAATPEIVTKLGMLDHNLYETDRIEIGRRLDNSRWLNFVELSSSTRWKEIESTIRELISTQQTDFPEKYLEDITFIDTLKGSDRVKGKLADWSLYLLQSLGPESMNKLDFQETTALIERAVRFQEARELVCKNLPLMIYFNEYGDIAPPIDTDRAQHEFNHSELWDYITQYRPQSPLLDQTVFTDNQSAIDKLKNGIHLATILSKELSMAEPIFLFDAPEHHLSVNEQEAVRTLITHTAKSHQCLYLAHSEVFFNPAEIGKTYSSSELAQSNSRVNDDNRRNQVDKV